MATKKELIKALTDAGVKLAGDEKVADLEALYQEHIGNGGGESSDGKAVVWLKQQAYVSDTERLNAGVYAMDEVPARFAKLSKREVEIFADGVVPSRKLVEIAKWAGFKHTEEMEDDEILSKVIASPVPFV